MSKVPHPPIVSRSEWLAERKELLEAEKRLTKQVYAVNAMRRRLPMVKLDKAYVFEGPNGQVRLIDLFDGRRQLVVYHFMFDPDWDKGCPGCNGVVDAMGDLKNARGAEYDTSWFVKGENHGLSVFFRLDDDVFHTYSTYARRCESLTDSYQLLDRTPYGRQEDFEVSPAGWPQRPTYG